MLSSLMFAVAIGLTTATPTPLAPRADCSCGYRDDQGNLWREALVSDFAGDYDRVMSEDYAAMSWGTTDNGYYKQNLLENLIPTTEGLQFKVNAYDGSGTIYVSEIESYRSDILYGTFRFDAKGTNVAGTCFGLFTYTSYGQETDIEINSAESTGSIWYTNQPSTDTNPTITRNGQAVDFSSAFFEHRFDWLPNESRFFFDSDLIATLTGDVQTDATQILVNHWSNGDPGWSQGPPTADAIATINTITAYFNSTSFTEAQFENQCNSAQVPECSV